ncbi:MAG: VPLPA-CTERM-specific exosortase XrtD [Geminicoccaceae bacterium]|nr:VPLPA-CTERM-specific exosortase XrtD [Geminicoccaceae bacterium]
MRSATSGTGADGFGLASAPGRSGISLVWLAVAVVAVLLLGLLFGDVLAAIAEHWALPEYNHGWLIPLISLAILWQRRERILADRSAGSWAGPALVVLGLALLALRPIALMHVPAAVGFVVALAGLGLAALGRSGMRLVWLPLGFLLFALPLPGTAYVILSTQLQLISSELSAGLLSLLGVSVFLDGNIIDLGVYKLQVAEACSGLRYLFPLSSFAFLCAWLYRAPLWARGLVLLSFVPITVGMNSLRIAVTGLFVEYGSLELAEGFFHLFEGWVISLGAIALMFGLMMLLAHLAGRPAGLTTIIDFDRIAGGAAPGGSTGSGQTAGRPGVPLAACLGLLLGALPALLWLAQRPVVIPERPGLVMFPLEVDGWRGRTMPLDQVTLATLEADDYLLADFTTAEVAAPVNLWVAYYGSQLDVLGTNIHSPKTCLPGNGWEFMRLSEVEVEPEGSGPFAVNRAVLVRGEEQMLVYYWYEQRGHRFADEIWTKIYLFYDMLTRQRADGALVRLATPILPGETASTVERRLSGFLEQAYPSLVPHVGA